MEATQANRRWALAGIGVGVFCIQLDSCALNLALPQIGRDFAGGDDGLQWVISGYLLSTGTFMLGAGRVGDAYGRRRLLTVGFALFGGASLLAALSPTISVLVCARVVQGIGAALIMPVGVSLLTNLYPPELRSRAIGAALGIGGVATAFGPFIGGIVTDEFSWRVLFWLNVPLTVAATLAVIRAEKDDHVRSSSAFDVPGLAAITAALAILAVAVERSSVWQPPVTASCLLAVGVISWLFVNHERSTPHPVIHVDVLRNAAFVAVTCAGSVVNTATVMVLYIVPFSLQATWGLSAESAGVAFLLPAIVLALAGPLAGRVTQRGAAPVMTASLALGGGSVLSLAWVPNVTGYLVAATASAAALGLGNSLTLTVTQAVITPERAGEASGITKTAITIAAGLGVGLSGAATHMGDSGLSASISATLVVTGLGCVTTCLVFALWSIRHARRSRSI